MQSASDPPKKLALGERAVQADGNEYNIFQIKEAGGPVEPVYPTEGTPLVIGPNGVFKNAPNPNAARLFQCYCFTAECQQLIVDVGGQRSVHPQVKEKAGRKPFKEIKTMKEDPAGVEKTGRGDQGALHEAIQGVTKRNGAKTMTQDTFTRRDMLKGPTALAVGTTVFAEPLRAAPPAAEAITPELIEAAKKEGKCSLLHGDGPAVRGAARQGVRAEVSRHQREGRALRRRARVHAHRPGVCRATSTRSTSSTPRTRRM